MARYPLGRPRQRRELQESLANVGLQIEKVDLELKKLTGRIETIRDEAADSQELVSRQRAGLEAPSSCHPGRCAVESAEGLPAQQRPGGARVWRW